jgi:hypothetical protein
MHNDDNDDDDDDYDNNNNNNFLDWYFSDFDLYVMKQITPTHLYRTLLTVIIRSLDQSPKRVTGNNSIS